MFEAITTLVVCFISGVQMNVPFHIFGGKSDKTLPVGCVHSLLGSGLGQLEIHTLVVRTAHPARLFICSSGKVSAFVFTSLTAMGFPICWLDETSNSVSPLTLKSCRLVLYCEGWKGWKENLA